MTTHFYLRYTQREKVSIWVRVRDSKYDLRIATPLTINRKSWDDKKETLKPGKTALEQNEYELIKARLSAIESGIVNYMNQCSTAHDLPTKAGVSKAIADVLYGTNDANRDIPSKMGGYLAWLIDRMKDGSFKYGGSKYDADTVKMWKVFRNVFNNFELYQKKTTGRPLAWETIEKATYDSFIEFCSQMGYMTKTTNKYVICFKAMIRYAADCHQMHNNTACLKFFSLIREVEGCSQTNIYLNDNEIQALYEMDLKKGSLKDEVRDIFLIGCYTGQRISDYGKLTADNFKTTARGTRVVKLIQEKTNNSVTIPIMNDNLLRIANKYKYNFPSHPDQVINRTIKEICKELSERVESLKETIPTAITKAEVDKEKAGKIKFDRDNTGTVLKPKYDLVRTHTARRSLITNLYKRKEFSNLQIMSISGHKTERNFYLYLSQTGDEIADEINAILEKEKEGGIDGKTNEELF